MQQGDFLLQEQQVLLLKENHKTASGELGCYVVGEIGRFRVHPLIWVGDIVFTFVASDLVALFLKLESLTKGEIHNQIKSVLYLKDSC